MRRAVLAALIVVLFPAGFAAAFKAPRRSAEAPRAQAVGYMKGLVTVSWALDPTATGYALVRDGTTVAQAGPAATVSRFSVVGGTHTLGVHSRRKPPPTTTTTTVPTTTVPTTTASGGGSKLSALYALEDGFHQTSVVTVSTGSQLSQAIGAAQPGQLIDVQAGTYSGQFDFSTRLPSCCAKFLFEPGVRFTGAGACCSTSVIVALEITGSYLILWGPADVSNPSWDNVRYEGAQHDVVGGGLRTHDAGVQNFLVQQSSIDVWLDGVESTNGGTHAACVSVGFCGGSRPNYDKAGSHGLYWGDGVTGGGVVNTYIHDQPNGYCIQVYQGNAAGSGSVLAFNTLARCTSPGDSGGDTGGLGAYFYDGGSSQTFVANVVVGARYAGLGSHATTGTAPGDVFWSDGQDVYNDSAPNLAVSDSHHLDPLLGAGDRPQTGSPVKGLSAAYAQYLPRTDFTGAPRVTADTGAFVAP